jgi:hypothetical protein
MGCHSAPVSKGKVACDDPDSHTTVCGAKPPAVAVASALDFRALAR